MKRDLSFVVFDKTCEEALINAFLAGWYETARYQKIDLEWPNMGDFYELGRFRRTISELYGWWEFSARQRRLSTR